VVNSSTTHIIIDWHRCDQHPLHIAKDVTLFPPAACSNGCRALITLAKF
jgi:hypothetical protein